LFDIFSVLTYYYIDMNNWKNEKNKSLFKAFSKLETEEEVANFCRDLMTESEIEEFASRWQVAQELFKGNSQRKVSAETGVSIATVTRVNQWLQRGEGGYKLLLERLFHTNPR
jgi:TrpR-related protein YerC/YecD